MQRFNSIVHLRGIAALAVVLFHATGYVSGYGAPLAITNNMRVCGVAVDIFFVVSGFMLTLVTQRTRTRTEFLSSRLARLGLPYWCVILALAAMSLAVPAAFRSFSWHGSDLALSLAFVPSLPSEGTIYPMLEPGWTLSLEMLFYLVLALVISFAPLVRSWLVVAGLCGIVLLGALLHPAHGTSIAWFFSQPLLVEFGVGTLLARAYLVGWRIPPAMGAGLLVVAVAALAFALPHPPAEYEAPRVFIYGLPATLIVASAISLESAGLWPESRVLAFAGTVSYSLYLTHVLVLAVAIKLLSGHVHGVWGDAAMLLISIPFAIGVSYIFYRLVEFPAFRISRSLQTRFREAAPARAWMPEATPKPEPA